MIDSGDLDPKTELDLLGDEDWEDLLDEIEVNDAAYQQDAALVADLFRQLASENCLAEPPIVPAHPLDELPQLATDDIRNSIDSRTATPAPASHLEGTAVFKGFFQPGSRNSSRAWVVVGVVGVAAIALLGMWWCQNRERLPPRTSPRARY